MSKIDPAFQAALDEARFLQEKFAYAQFSTVNGGYAAFKPKNGGRWVSFTKTQLQRLATLKGPNQEEAKEALNTSLWN